jgi:phosphoglucomutase
VPGAVISASHNPWSDNGIKFFAAGGRKLSDDIETALENALDEVLAAGIVPDDVVASPTETDVVDEWCTAVATSVSAVRPLSIVIDCANVWASMSRCCTRNLMVETSMTLVAQRIPNLCNKRLLRQAQRLDSHLMAMPIDFSLSMNTGNLSMATNSSRYLPLIFVRKVD